MKKRRARCASPRCGRFRAGLRSASCQESGGGWPSLEQILYDWRAGRPKSAKRKAAVRGRFRQTILQIYFGGGVVLGLFFLLAFLPPFLWPFLPDLVVVVLAVVAFFPGGSGCGFNELLSLPVCAMTRPAPRSNVITNVEIF